MADSNSCTGCGEALPLAVSDADARLCDACEANAAAPDDERTPRPAKLKRGRDARGRRESPRGVDPDKDDAHDRARGARRCASSMYLATVAIPACIVLQCVALPGVIAAVLLAAGLLSCLLGILGLWTLHRVGRGPDVEDAPAGIVRASVKMARGAGWKAAVGITVGAIDAALGGLLFLGFLLV